MKKNLLLFLYIISLLACCIEVDISVPSFPDMVSYFNTTEALAQHTVSINFLGFFISALMLGPLADSFGRRPVMLTGNALLMLGAIGCVFAPTIAMLLLARFVQGIGAATSAVVVFAMIADTNKGEGATRLIGMMNCVLTCLMSASPIAGSYLNEIFGWRGSYGVVAIISTFAWVMLVFALPETQKSSIPFDTKAFLQNAKKLLSSLPFLKMSFAPSLLYAAYLSFITSASFLYMETFKLPMHWYALHQALIVGMFALVSLFSGSILKYIGKARCVYFGIGMSMLGALSFVIVSLIQPGASLTTVSVSIFAIGAALFYPVVFAQSLEVFPNLKATATSLIMVKRAVIIALSTGITAYFYNGSPVVIAIIMSVIVCMSTVLTCFMKIDSNDYLH